MKRFRVAYRNGALAPIISAAERVLSDDGQPKSKPGGTTWMLAGTASVSLMATPRQFVSRSDEMASTLVYSGVMSLLISLVHKFTTGLRVTEEEKCEGLDIVLQGKQVF